VTFAPISMSFSGKIVKVQWLSNRCNTLWVLWLHCNDEHSDLGGMRPNPSAYQFGPEILGLKISAGVG